VWLESAQQLAEVRLDDISVLSSRISVIHAARNLGVVVDSQLSMSARVSTVCRGGYYQLRQLRPLTKCMTDFAIKILTRAYITSRIDYSSGLYLRTSDSLMSHLKLIRNEAAHLVTRLGRREHITSVGLLRPLHWLPVCQRELFKLATLVHRLLEGTAPVNLSEEWTLNTSTGVRSLHSTNTWTCTVRRSHNRFGDRSFTAASPSLWNRLL
jgi:hypothetical protein